MVFWVPRILDAVIYPVDPKRDYNFDNHTYTHMMWGSQYGGSSLLVFQSSVLRPMARLRAQLPVDRPRLRRPDARSKAPFVVLQ